MPTARSLQRQTPQGARVVFGRETRQRALAPLGLGRQLPGRLRRPAPAEGAVNRLLAR